MSRVLLAISIAAALAACSAERAPAADEVATPATPASGQASTPAPAADTPPADAPADTPPADGADTMATFKGYGDVAFGTVAADMEKAWAGELNELGKEYNESCYFMSPTWVKVPAEFSMMIGDGKFARYGTESEKFIAPGGGRIGMSKAQIAQRYTGIEEQAHHYTDGQYLRIKAPAGGNAVLIFETNGKGDDAKITEWRVGVPPYVDYVEGCA